MSGSYGWDCKSKDEDSIKSDCGNFGITDIKNAVTGCQCKVNGVVTEYHGWYCDIPNYVICEAEEFYVHKITNKVGDLDNCKDCKGATFRNCAKCEQKRENGWIRKLQFQLFIYF